MPETLPPENMSLTELNEVVRKQIAAFKEVSLALSDIQYLIENLFERVQKLEGRKISTVDELDEPRML